MKETENNSNVETLFEIKPVDSNNDKFVIVLGQFRISKWEFPTKTEAERYLKSKPWEIIFNTATLIAKGVFLEGYDKLINNNQNSEDNDNN